MVKNYSLKWTNKASLRLKDIYNWYLDNYGKKRATKVKKSIITIAEKIIDNPFLYPICDKLELPNELIRNALVHKTYWVVYEIKDNNIFILQILHAAINPDEYLSI